MGGNDIDVQYDGDDTNLHAAWDSDIPESISGGSSLTSAKSWASDLIKGKPYPQPYLPIQSSRQRNTMLTMLRNRLRHLQVASRRLGVRSQRKLVDHPDLNGLEVGDGEQRVRVLHGAQGRHQRRREQGHQRLVHHDRAARRRPADREAGVPARQVARCHRRRAVGLSNRTVFWFNIDRHFW